MPNVPAPGVLNCDLLVFDLDGTLVDSETDLANAVNGSLESLNRLALPHSQIVSFIGDGAGPLIERSLDAGGGRTPRLQEEALSRFIAHYREHLLDSTRAYPGVVEALNAIRTAAPSLPMAVLTNKPVNPSRAICDGLTLSRFFFANYGGNSFANKKPDPEGLHTLMAQAERLLGRPVDPARTIMVGDSHVDVETARAAGIRSLGCTYGLSPASLKASHPDALATAPAEWLPQLRLLLS